MTTALKSEIADLVNLTMSLSAVKDAEDAEIEGFDTAIDWWSQGEPKPMPTCPYKDPALAAAWDRGFTEGASK